MYELLNSITQGFIMSAITAVKIAKKIKNFANEEAINIGTIHTIYSYRKGSNFSTEEKRVYKSYEILFLNLKNKQNFLSTSYMVELKDKYSQHITIPSGDNKKIIMTEKFAIKYFKPSCIQVSSAL